MERKAAVINDSMEKDMIMAQAKIPANIAIITKGEEPPKPSMIIPVGKVMIAGKLVDRSKVGFRLQQHPEQKEFFRAMDNTVYHRSVSGQLRCVNRKKLTKAEKKAAKRDKKKTLFSVQ